MGFAALILALLPLKSRLRSEEPSSQPPERKGEAAPTQAAEEKALRIIEQAGGGDAGPVLKKSPPGERKPRAPAKKKARGLRVAPEVERAEEAPPGWSGYPWAWGWYPWYPAPQTYRPPYAYPPSITHVPRLGLQYNYPYAAQMGLRIPDDSSPLDHPPNLGPFVGIVQAAQEQLREEEESARREREEAVRAALSELREKAVALMKEKEFQRAGRILTEAFAVSDDPAIPLLLAEALFGLEKPKHAEAVLRHALKAPGGARALPKSIVEHFPSAEDFEERLARLEASKEAPDLLLGYLLVHSKNPERGIELLRKLATEKPDDEAAALLYRRYLRAIVPE